MTTLCRFGRIACLAALGGALSGSPGCGPSEPAQEELVFLLPADPTNLDPRIAPDAYSDRIARLLFAPLLRRTPDGGLRPHLAEEVVQEGPTTVRVRLRPDATFCDGRPVRAEDVRATFASVQDPELRSIKRLFLEPVRSIRVEGEREVVFELRSPHAPFLGSLAGVGIARAERLNGEGPTAGGRSCGSGAFRLAEVVPGSHVLLERRAEWWGGPGGAERLRFRVVPDATVRALELLHGSGDMTQNDLPPHVYERLAREPELRLERGPSTLVKYLSFNLERPPLDDRRVRRAIAHAIDRDALIRHKLRGFGARARSFLHEEHWAFEPRARDYAHDPETASRLLTEAGFPPREDGSPRLKLVYRTSLDATAVAIARVLRRQLAQVGIDMELRTNDWGVFFSDIQQGDFDLFTLSAVGVHDPDWYSFVLHSDSFPPDGANRGRYRNARVDELLEAGRAKGGREERAPLYREVQRIAAEELPLLPLWYQHNVVVAGRNVGGYALQPDADFTALERTGKDGPR